MLSVLIPIYNFDVSPFVLDLKQQCVTCNISFEIICLDDYSDNKFKNATLLAQENITYEELKENIGRSKIRNLLAEKAKYKNLLFLDCDSKTNDKSFIANYINNIDGNSVVYGGRNYESNQPSNQNEHFRWWYGVNRETISSATRRKNMHCHFMTNNFCIPKAIYQGIKLDETLKGYGHEDTLFGIELKNKNIPINHINNSLCHIGLEDFGTFITKTEEGITNLNKLIKQRKIDKTVKLIKGYKVVKLFKLEGFILSYFQKNKAKILGKLQKNEANLKWFDFYKLGYLVSLNKS